MLQSYNVITGGVPDIESTEKMGSLSKWIADVSFFVELYATEVKNAVNYEKLSNEILFWNQSFSLDPRDIKNEEDKKKYIELREKYYNEVKYPLNEL